MTFFLGTRIVTLTVAATVLTGTLAVAAPTGAGKRPNIIFLMDDQHRWDALGCQDPAVKTPALDRLATEGIRFDQAVCQAPMCIPSRHSLMLGLYPHQLGILSNGPGLREDQLPCDPLAELLRKAGYQTAGFGKMHWLAAGATRGFEVRYTPCDNEKGAITMNKDDPAGIKHYNEEVASYGDGEEWPAGYVGCTSKVPEAEHRDGWSMNRCLEFLDKGRDEQKPLFLYLSFLKPHAGANVPAGWEDLYQSAAMPVPPQPLLEMVEPCHATGNDRQDMYREFWSKATNQQWQQMVLRYRANCSWIDSMFGRVMDKLRTTGLLENCLIVYVSDHGEMLGERYYRFNKYCLFDASVRVPLILAGTAVPPAKRGTTDHRMAEEVDIYPTIAAVAGISNLPAKPGENLLDPSARKAGFCEYSDRPGKVSFMWRTGEHKLILSFSKDDIGKRTVQAGDVIAGEFYDLTADPKEWHNLYGDTASTKARDQMTRELVTHLNNVALEKATRPKPER